MKREIKFRAYNTDTKEMELVLQIDFVNQCVFVLPERNLEGGNQEDWMLSNTMLMQSTSLLDKNGKEIYEGDIVKWIDEGQEHTGQVFWNVHAYGFRVQMKMGYMPSFKLLPEHLEVIGNIYENPELLTP